MPVVTDLTWTQLNTALKTVVQTNNDLITLDSYGQPTEIDVAAIIQSFPVDSDATTSTGVIKFMARLFDACREAQIAANANQPTGERLNAFAAPTNQAPVGTFVPIIRTMTTRADLSSASRVIGTNV